MEGSDLREQIDRLIETDSWAAASRYLAELWRRERSCAAAAFVVSRYERLRERLALRPYRMAILRSFTVEPLVPLLRASAFAHGIDLNVQLGAFNAYAQEILDAESWLYRFAPQAVILAVQTCDIAPDLWRDYADLGPEERSVAVARVTEEFRAWVRAFQQRAPAHLIIHTLEQPTAPSRGLLDGQSESSQSQAIRTTNEELLRLARSYKGVYILDYDALVARYGRLYWRDERKWVTSRLPIGATHLVHLAEEWLRFLAPLTGKTVKVLTVDLDNTLWGGVLGEDGMAGIRIGAEYTGTAFQAFQRALLDLRQRGILLAISSKNNQEEALEVLENHSGMLLRPRHFAAVRINWNDKAQNLREIASELDIGTDELALVDDSPAERELVRSQLPEVTVIDLPEDPMGYAAALRASPAFERLGLTPEDQNRNIYYLEQRRRTDAELGCATKEDFYRSLQQEAEVAPVSAATVGRVAQLTQKTNQFNLTTRRYTEQQIMQLAATSGWQVLSIRVRDRFGDNGLVGVAIIHQKSDLCKLDTFLLSCRVIGRTIETAFLSYLVEQARDQGAVQLQGWFVPTPKNIPAENFYGSHGFQLVEQNEKGSLWALELPSAKVSCPSWIRLLVPDRMSKARPNV